MEELACLVISAHCFSFPLLFRSLSLSFHLITMARELYIYSVLPLTEPLPTRQHQHDNIVLRASLVSDPSRISGSLIVLFVSVLLKLTSFLFHSSISLILLDSILTLFICANFVTGLIHNLASCWSALISYVSCCAQNELYLLPGCFFAFTHFM